MDTSHKTSPSSGIAVRHLAQTNAERTERRSVINELNFTYKRLLKLLPSIMKRVEKEPVGEVLEEQDRVDHDINTRLGSVASQNGEPPQPCACDDANALIEEVYHADRDRYYGKARLSVLIDSLSNVRLFLIRAWGRLIERLPTTSPPGFRQEAVALQQREVDLHKDLVELANQVGENSVPKADKL